MKARAWLWTVLVCLSCGGGGDAPKPITLEEFCTQKADKECQAVAPKCGTPVDPCKIARKAVCMTFAADNTVAPRVFKPENTADCLNKTDQLYRKTAALTPADLAVVDDACKYVFQGNVKKDETCANNNKYECADRVICDKNLCADQQNIAGNQQCANAGAVCVAGFYCTMDGQVMRCLAKKMSTEACSATAPCLESLRCSGGTCMARLGAGMPCTSHDDCASPGTPYCDPYAGNVCDTGLLFAPGSASCTAFTSGGSGGGQGGSPGGDAGGGAGGASGSDGGADAPAAEGGI
jgi:uncharacterized membrane protein YgcG